MSAEPNFDVVVEGFSGSLDEWSKAQAIPVSELPPLSDDEKEFARKFGLAEEEWAREQWALAEGEKRLQERTEALGEKVAQILSGFGAGYSLEQIVAKPADLRWLLRIRTPEGMERFDVPQDLGDDVLDLSHPRYHGILKGRLSRVLQKVV
jgi:hypothetical protein